MMGLDDCALRPLRAAYLEVPDCQDLALSARWQDSDDDWLHTVAQEVFRAQHQRPKKKRNFTSPRLLKYDFALSPRSAGRL